MLEVLGRSRRTCDGLTRRTLLEAAGAGLFGLTAADLLAAESVRTAQRPRAKSVMFVFLFGGPSQLETFDMKPGAASAVRGPYRPIASRTRELRICEHLPLLASGSQRYCVVRTLNHQQNDHNGCHIIQTGQPIPPAERGSAGVDATEKDFPAMGSVVEYIDRRAGKPRNEMPGYIYLPKRLGHFEGYDRSGQYGGWLGRAYSALAADIRKRHATDNPFYRACTDDELDFRLPGLAMPADVTLDRLDRRASLLEQFRSQVRRLDDSHTAHEFDRLRAQALSFVTSTRMRDALDIRREPPTVRDRYGRHLFGQSLLMGRRMIEAGARFVTVVWDMAVQGDARSGWDMHEGLTTVMKTHLLPGLDQSFSALLDDMDASGLLQETLVVCLGEMGRTPMFNNRGQTDGRDHWSFCFPCVLAGAGIRGGTVYGRSDKDAAYPAERPVSPADIAATIYQALGIDPLQFVPDSQGRPHPIAAHGHALDELFG